MKADMELETLSKNSDAKFESPVPYLMVLYVLNHC